ncbi:MAG: DUF6443 domain-containing protein [Cyclobacteriaceae bacterium]
MKIFHTLLLTAFSLSLFAQSVSISGPSSSAFGATKSYTVTVSGIDLSQADIGWYASSGNSINDISDTQVNVTWNSSGTQSVTFDLYIGEDYYSDTKTVTVSAPPVATPSIPQLITNGTCIGQATLRRVGTPPSGVTWYWQGKNSNGTSTTLGSGQNYYPNSSTGGSGYYYLRARNSTGSWSSGSARSPYVTITTSPEAPGGNSGSNACGATTSYILQAVSEETDITGLTHKWYIGATGPGTVSHTVVSSGGQYLTKRTVSSTTTYWVSAFRDGCESARTPITATIYSNTVPEIDFNTPSEPPCEGTTFQIRVEGGVNSTFQWYDRLSGGSVLGTGSTYSTSVNYSETSNGSESFWVGGTLRDARGCPYPISPRRQVTVTVLPNTSQVNISGNTTVSNGAQSVSYSASASHASSYSWTISPLSAGSVTQNGSQCSVNFSSSFYGVATLSVTASNSCNSTQDSHTITVLPPDPSNPTISVSGVCSDDGQATLTRNGSPPSGVTWYWQGRNSNGTSTNLGSGSSYTANDGSGTYYIRARDSNTSQWSSGSGSRSVTITTTPEAPGGNSGSNACGAAPSYILQAASEETDISGLTHKWYTGPTGPGTVAHEVVSSGGQYLTKRTVSSTTTYWVSAFRDGCESARTPITATIYSNTVPVIDFNTPSDPPCEGTTFEIGVEGGVNSTFQWYDASSGGNFLGGGSTYSTSVNYSETSSGSKSFWVGGTLRDSRGCAYTISPRKQVTVTVLPNTSQVNISGNTTVSNGAQTVSYTASASHASSYSWTISPFSAGSVTQNGSQCSVNFNSSFYGVATLSVTASNSCNSTQDNHIITVLPPVPPAPSLIADGTCVGQATLQRSGSPPTGVIWYWQGKNPNGTSTTLGSGEYYYPDESTGGSGRYYIRAYHTATSSWSSASGESLGVTITTTPEAPGGNSGSNACGAPTNYTLQAASEETDISGLTHKWYTDANGPGTVAHAVVSTEGQHLTEVFVGSSATYWVSALRDGCESARTPITATIYSNTVPVIDFNTPSDPPCEGTTFEIEVEGGVNSTFQWYDVSSGGNSLGGGSTYSTSVNYSETSSGSESFWVGGTLRDSRGCTYTISPRREVTVTVLPDTGPVTITGSPKVANGAQSVSYSASASHASDYTWSINPPSAGFVTQNGSQCSVNFNSSFYGVATLSVTASNSCNTTQDDHTITVLPPNPPAPILSSDGTCVGQATLQRSGSPPLGVVWYWQGQNSNGTNMTLGSDEYYYPDESTGGSGRYYIRAYDTNTDSWSSASGESLGVTITTTPEAPGGNSGFNACGAATYNLQAASEETDISGLTHKWYIEEHGLETVAHEVVSTDGQYLTEVIAGSSVTYWVSAFRDGCESARTEISATILTKPNVDFDTPGEEQCEGTTFEIGVGGGVNSTFEWYEVPTDGVSIGSGSTIDVNLAYSETTGGFKSFWVEGTLRDAQGCTYPISPREKVVVSIALPVESVSITGEEAVCEAAESVNYTASADNANNYLWSINPPSAGFLSPNGAECNIDFNPGFFGPATLSVVASNNGCTPKMAEHFLNVSQETDSGVVSGSITKYGVASGSIILSEHIGSILKWQSKTTGDWEDIMSTENPYQYSNVIETTSYRAVLKSGECNQMNSATATITILDVAMDLGDCPTIRPGQKSIISVSSAYSSYQWLRNGTEIPGEVSSQLEATKPGNYSVTINSAGNGTFTTGDAIISSQLKMKQNAVFTYNYQIFTDTIEDLFEFNPEQQIISTNVYDGLGRSIQQIALNSSPSQNDIIVPLAYDQFGRQDKSYLPYVDTDLCRIHRPNAIDEQLAFYNPSTAPFLNISTDVAPFSKSRLELSPLNRLLEQGSPGEAWQPDPDPLVTLDKTVSYSYEVNKSADSVLLFDVEDLGTKQFYDQYELYKNTIADEDGHLTITFRDKLGQVVLKQSYESLGDKWASTYYIYNDLNQLRMVLPPEPADRLDAEFFAATGNERQDFLDRWAFQYEYDTRGRMTMKKVPGADTVRMVYDRWDRLVLTQDGNQKNPEVGESVQWSFTKYDSLNRPIITGLVDDYATIEADVKSSSGNDRSEAFTGSGTTQYENVTQPQGAFDYYSITFYDNYGFRDNFELGTEYGYSDFSPVFTSPSDVDTFHILPVKHESVKGQVTGTKTRILGSNTGTEDDYLETITYYDNKYRVIQMVSENHLGGIDVISTQYDFVGNVKRVHSTHNDGSTTIEQLTAYTYDHANRLLSCDHTLNQGEQVRLYTNEYNELGELVKKQLHQDQGSIDYAQTIEYEYNIRSWLRKINGASLDGTSSPGPPDLFNMELIYNTTAPNLPNN